jgi:hypothetical protein
MFRARSTHLWLGPVVVMLALVTSAAGIANAEGPISADAYDRCRAISDEKARLHCFEGLSLPRPPTVPSPAPAQTVPLGSEKNPDLPQDLLLGSPAASSSVPIAGKWRLVRTPNPRDGQSVVSIMTTAELSGSDVDFAGLNLRCAEQDFEILVFLIRPFPPRAQPAVTFNGKTFQGNVVSPGTAILLPRTASTLAKEQWQSLPNLAIDVDDAGTKTHGLVSLNGFATALQTLATACLTH